MGQKACGYVKSDRACGLQNGAGWENPQQAFDKIATIKALNSTKIPPEQKT